MEKLTYNGKQYYGLYRGGDLMELRSLTKDDVGFKLDKTGWRYIKMVSKEDCKDIHQVWLCVEIYGERRDAEVMDYEMNHILTVGSCGWIDNYKWFSIDELEKYYLVLDEYFVPKEENKIYLSKDNVKEYAKIFCGIGEKGK